VATNKKAISAYIPSELEEYLTKYCTEYDITRKDKSGEIKPALGTAVVEILKIFFSSEHLPSPLPDNVPLLPSNVVTEDRLKFVLSELEISSNVSSSLPSNVVSQDDLSKALSKIPSIVNEQLETAISQGEVAELIANQFSILKTELYQTLEEKVASLASELEIREDYDLPNIAKVDKKTLANIVDDQEELPTQIDKSSLDPIFDEDLDADWNKLKVSELRKVITIKGLSKKFREKLGKSPRESKKAEIIKFLNETEGIVR
jgi:hypothetical protein